MTFYCNRCREDFPQGPQRGHRPAIVVELDKEQQDGE